MCINVYKIILLVYICCVGILWISRSGNSDDSKQAEVTLSVNKDTLIADREDAMTFTIMHAGIGVTADAIIRSVMDGQTLDGSTFSTSKAGTYAFEASYDDYISKLITIVASAVPDTPSKFVGRICAMELTGTWYAMCPAGVTHLNYLISSNYEGVVYLMSFHVDGTGADPMTIEQSSLLSRKFSIFSYPSCMVDMHEAMGLSENYSTMRTIFNKSLEEYPASCGVAIQLQCNGQADVAVSVKSEKSAEYHLILYAVENGLKYQQNDGGIYRDYTHNHVVRRLLPATANDGELGHIAVGKEKSISYAIIMEGGWSAKNLSSYASIIDENGYVSNLAVCKAIDDGTDYKYTND